MSIWKRLICYLFGHDWGWAEGMFYPVSPSPFHVVEGHWREGRYCRRCLESGLVPIVIEPTEEPPPPPDDPPRECSRCETEMVTGPIHTREGGATSVTFTCPGCGARVEKIVIKGSYKQQRVGS